MGKMRWLSRAAALFSALLCSIAVAGASDRARYVLTHVGYGESVLRLGSGEEVEAESVEERRSDIESSVSTTSPGSSPSDDCCRDADMDSAPLLNHEHSVTSSATAVPLNTGTGNYRSGWNYFNDVTAHVGQSYSLDTDCVDRVMDYILDNDKMTWTERSSGATGYGLPPSEVGVYDMRISSYTYYVFIFFWYYSYSPSDSSIPVFTITVEDHSYPSYDPGNPISCMDPGIDHYYTCSVCGVMDTSRYLPFAHDWISWVNNGDETHTAHCSRDATHTAVVECSGGTFVDRGDGTHSSTCAYCSAVYGVSEHTYGEWYLQVAPTDTGTGLLLRDCVACTSKLSAELPTLGSAGDSYQYQEILSPDCTAEGTGRYTVQLDGQTFSFDVAIPALGHSFGEWSFVTYPTQNWGGTIRRTCSRCSATEDQDIPALGAADYDYREISAPTCTVNGSGVYTVTMDGQVFTFSVSVAATGHDFSEYVYDDNATCYQDGTETATCPRCGNTHSRTVADSMKEHEWEYRYDENTHVYTCIWGGEIQGSEEEHTFGEWEVTAEATHTEEGERARSCLVCGYMETAAIEMFPDRSSIWYILGISLLGLLVLLVLAYMIHLAIDYRRERELLK